MIPWIQLMFSLEKKRIFINLRVSIFETKGYLKIFLYSLQKLINLKIKKQQREINIRSRNMNLILQNLA